MDSKWLKKTIGVKYWEVLVHFDGFQIRSHCVERAAIWVNVGVEWICRDRILIYVIYRWTLLLQIQSMSINY